MLRLTKHKITRPPKLLIVTPKRSLYFHYIGLTCNRTHFSLILGDCRNNRECFCRDRTFSRRLYPNGCISLRNRSQKEQRHWYHQHRTQTHSTHQYKNNLLSFKGFYLKYVLVMFFLCIGYLLYNLFLSIQKFTYVDSQNSTQYVEKHLDLPHEVYVHNEDEQYEQYFEELNDYLFTDSKPNHKLGVLIGPSGCGKSVLIRQVMLDFMTKRFVVYSAEDTTFRWKPEAYNQRHDFMYIDARELSRFNERQILSRLVDMIEGDGCDVAVVVDHVHQRDFENVQNNFVEEVIVKVQQSATDSRVLLVPEARYGLLTNSLKPKVSKYSYKPHIINMDFPHDKTLIKKHVNSLINYQAQRNIAQLIKNQIYGSLSWNEYNEIADTILDQCRYDLNMINHTVENMRLYKRQHSDHIDMDIHKTVSRVINDVAEEQCIVREMNESLDSLKTIHPTRYNRVSKAIIRLLDGVPFSTVVAENNLRNGLFPTRDPVQQMMTTIVKKMMNTAFFIAQGQSEVKKNSSGAIRNLNTICDTADLEMLLLSLNVLRLPKDLKCKNYVYEDNDDNNNNNIDRDPFYSMAVRHALWHRYSKYNNNNK